MTKSTIDGITVITNFDCALDEMENYVEFVPIRARKTCSKQCSDELNARSDAKASQAANDRRQQLKQLKDSWLTIPLAPDYEINKQLQCRNKVTGHVLKLTTAKSGNKYYSLIRNIVTGKRIHMQPQSLWRQAVAAITNDNFVQLLPPLDQYEVNDKGICRRIRTKKILRPKGRGKTYTLYDRNLNSYFRSRNSLLWEAHGKIVKGFRLIPVAAENQVGKFFFPTCTACAEFLKDKLYYSFHTIVCYLWQRKPTIGDWKFTYLDQSPDDVNWDIRGLGNLARHQAKAEASSCTN